MRKLLAKILASDRYSTIDKELIEHAFDFAQSAHQGQQRLSGEDFLNHPLSVALFLKDLGFDAKTVSAAILHDILEDTSVDLNELKQNFDSDIVFLVQGVTKLGGIEYLARPLSKSGKTEIDRYIASLKRMFLAMAKDVRVIFIKLADRYHNIKTLDSLPEEDRKRIALETIEIYAPIAARLGMGKLKGQLEDLAFPHAYNDEYQWLIRAVKDRFDDRIRYINKISPVIKNHLLKASLKVVDLHSRAKHHYSLYQKLKKSQSDPDKVFDLVAVRIIVPDISSCYEALGVIHKHYKPLPGLIKDYISLPKPNGYQSLHTTIFCEQDRVVEVQIRTPLMHDHAENGIAAHWAYSEQDKTDNAVASAGELAWINNLKEFMKNMYLQDDLSQFKTDFFGNRIFAFTPHGEVKDLPEGATPLDFAYSIHTELGHATQGAKVNGKMVPLNYGLASGDIVEIIKRKNGKPSFDWLKIVKTGEARRKIKGWFNQQKIRSEKINQDKRPIAKKTEKLAQTKIGIGEPIIQNQPGLLYKIAKCCKPNINNKITGYLTVNQGVTIHVKNCQNLKNAMGGRLLSAVWSKKA